MFRKFINYSVMVVFLATTLFGGSHPVTAQSPQAAGSNAPAAQTQTMTANDEIGTSQATGQMRTTTQAMRQAAASHQAGPAQSVEVNFAGINPATASKSTLGKVADSLSKAATSIATMLAPLSTPDYFGSPNYANSPLPLLAGNGTLTGGIHKFVDGLPGLCGVTPVNDLGQCIPLAVPDKTTFAGSAGNPAADYYEIALVEYHEQLHKDLPAAGTQLRGYVQVETAAIRAMNPNPSLHIALTYPNGQAIKDASGAQVFAVTKPSYLGPTILATRNRPVRVKFTNYLPTGPAGALFIPTDTTYMGAGMGPGGSIYSITVTNGGAGYTSAPTVAFTAPPAGGTMAAATANVLNGKVVSITVTNGGDSYTTTPTITLNGGGYTTRATATTALDGQPGDMYTQNRATLHLHGGNTPWISDGTTHQWTTPRGEVTAFSKGDSVAYVPDMWFNASGSLIGTCAGATTCAVAGATNDPGTGSLSFYWTNQESGRLMFYHDHAYGITRLNVYAGEAAGYLLTDPAQENALALAGVPGTIGTTPDLKHVIPLIIQDKTFVPDPATQLPAEDPTWNVAQYGGLGNLWFPHVYTPNQNPYDITGSNAYGRWDYGPWFWPAQPASSLTVGTIQCPTSAYGAPVTITCPGTPNPSGTPEGYQDTPVINGTAYPTLTVDPTAYRFQMLMAGNDRAWNLGWYLADPLTVAVTKGGSGYTSAPAVSFTGTGTGAAATAVVSTGTILQSGILFTNVGAGYTAAPTVTINGDGAGATATAALDNTGHVGSITVTAGGTGYTIASVVIAAPTCAPLGTATCKTATATTAVTPSGIVTGIIVTNPGTGWTSTPTVTLLSGGGSGATAIASVNTEVKMVDATPHSATSTPKLCSAVNPTSGAMLVTALTDPSGNPLNGTGLPANCWPATWPTDGRDGGVPDPLTVGPPFIQLGTEGGLLPSAVIIPSTPVTYEYNRRSITVLNIFNHGLTLGPAERADVMVDFSKYAGKTLILYNDAPAPVPAFDPRVDYYTGDPDQTTSGGAPTTMPGYGPNTRTLMQVKVNAVAGSITGTTVSSVTLTNGGTGYTAPTATISGGGGTGATASVSGTVGAVTLTGIGVGYTNPVVTFSGGNGTGASASMASGVLNSLSLSNSGAGYAAAPVVSFTGGGTGSGAAAKTTISVTGITSVLPGAGYGAAPTVTITDPTGTGTGATASSTVSVTGYTFTSGAGYSSAPAVLVADSLGGIGTGAAAKATVSVTGYIVGGTGNGLYSSTTTATVADSLGSTGSGATASVTITGGVITAVTMLTPGTGYTAPVVTINDATGSGTIVTPICAVDSLSIVTPGSHYKAPVVSFSGGGTPTLAATGATTGVVDSLTILTPGAKYTAPQVGFSGTGGATATTTGVVDSLTLTNPGSGYSSAPAVVFTGTNTTLAAASATIAATGLVLISGGSGYTSAPTITIPDTAPGTGSGATAKATLTLNAINLTNPGSGYTTVPSVTITDPTGTGAAATASFAAVASSFSLATLQAAMPAAFKLTQDVPIIPEPDFPAGWGQGGPNYARIQDNFITAWIGNAVGGLTVNNIGSGYQAIPTVTISGGGGTGATATVTIAGGLGSIAVVNPGSRYNGAAPTVTISAPPAGGTQAFATATVAAGRVTTIKVTVPGSGYTSAPTVTLSAPGGGGVTATARALLNGSLSGVTLTNGGTGYTSAPTITFKNAVGDTTGVGAAAVAESMHMEPKAIQELFTTDYGRMNATLGVEIPFTTFTIQTTIPYGFIDPPTEMFKDGQTQIWKITHNGVDTHFIHFHLFTVQVLNRVGWDGMVKPPDANEIAWKDTVRMNPLEDIIVAIRPMKQILPWELPNEVRPLDVTMPIGSSMPKTFANIDPYNNPAVVTNDLTNFGWEYTVHCHLLGHEENDMMRPMAMAVTPDAPSGLAATKVNNSRAVTLSWKDNSINESGFTVQRSINGIGWVDVSNTVPADPGVGGTVTFKDTTVARSTPYFYRVVANNVVGYTKTYVAPTVGYPTISADSAPTTQIQVTTNNSNNTNALTAADLIFASTFQDLSGFASVTGNVVVAPQAAMGGSAEGMVASLDGSGPAFVVDNSPTNETSYNASFYFNSHWTGTGLTPIDIFTANNASANPIFGVQYMRDDDLDSSYQIRGWVVSSGTKVYMPWITIENQSQRIQLAWLSGAKVGFSLYLNDNLVGTLLNLDTHLNTVKQVTLGPSGVTADDTGIMYFSEFASSRTNAVSWFTAFMPTVSGK